MNALPVPTVIEAKNAVHIVFDTFAAAEDGRLVVGANCPRIGRQSRVCVARVEGPQKFRFRVVVTETADAFLVRSREAPR